jgi:GNAT superfamily N-acetyltransferase
MDRPEMPDRIDVAPLTSEDLPAAAELLAARQRRLRRALPILPEPYADRAATLPLVEALASKDGAFGVIGRSNGKAFGFLLGYPRLEPIWGRAAWSPIEGSALADGTEPELVRDLYAAWSEHFVGQGYFRQYVHAASDDPELMAAWVRTGFGQMQAHAARDLELTADPPAGVTVRTAHAEDIGLVADMLPLVGRALMKPPAYAIQLPEVWSTFGAAGEEELADPDARYWVAIAKDGRALALASFYDAEPGPMTPDRATELAFAMTRPEERGRGLMRALTAAGFAEAKAAGAIHAVADWRTASLPTHRSWVALGFEPLYYRLHRHIDERVGWAATTPLAEPG